MPKTYYKSTAVTVEGFSFTFPNTKKNIKDIITPKDELINIELGLEEIESSLAPEFFFLLPFRDQISELCTQFQHIFTRR